MSETYEPNSETPLSASLDAKLDAEFDASTINLFEAQVDVLADEHFTVIDELCYEENENEDRFMDGLREE